MEAAEWLMEQRVIEHSPASLLDGLALNLERDGFALGRISAWLPTQHPELWGSQLFWRRGQGASAIKRGLDIFATETFQGSPGQAIVEGKRPLRCRLDVPRDQLAFAMLAEIADEGGIDYFALPISMGHRADLAWMSFATDRAPGFSDRELDELAALATPLSFHFQLLAERYAKHSLLEVYLGPNAARHVLAGAFHRGTGTVIRAAIWFCDLRGFTVLGNDLEPRALVAILDKYFECVATPIEEQGGEILKLIGDAALAIFPIGDDGPSEPCRRACRAAELALENLSSLRAEHPDWPPLAMGVALHLGDVFYGNIGGRSRLDFTAIGSAINEVTRIESLCKELATSLLMSATFAAALPATKLVGFGEHRLRGVSAAQEIYTLPTFAPQPVGR